MEYSRTSEDGAGFAQELAELPPDDQGARIGDRVLVYSSSTRPGAVDECAEEKTDMSAEAEAETGAAETGAAVVASGAGTSGAVEDGVVTAGRRILGLRSGAFWEGVRQGMGPRLARQERAHRNGLDPESCGP